MFRTESGKPQLTPTGKIGGAVLPWSPGAIADPPPHQTKLSVSPVQTLVRAASHGLHCRHRRSVWQQSKEESQELGEGSLVPLTWTAAVTAHFVFKHDRIGRVKQEAVSRNL